MTEFFTRDHRGMRDLARWCQVCFCLTLGWPSLDRTTGNLVPLQYTQVILNLSFQGLLNLLNLWELMTKAGVVWHCYVS